MRMNIRQEVVGREVGFEAFQGKVKRPLTSDDCKMGQELLLFSALKRPVDPHQIITSRLASFGIYARGQPGEDVRGN